MKLIDKNKPVMVTGATGYVAGWLVKKLLDEGLTVHAPVRDPRNMEKLKFLNDLAVKSSGTIKYFKADLLDIASYEEAMNECELIFHTASPFINKVKNPQRELVDPALIGTKNVLESANKIKSVKRIVLTSSCAAIFGDTIDLLDLPNGTATEANWNTSSTLNHQAYCYSKSVAERAAWNIYKAQDRWDLVVINPSLVIGPGINPRSTSESFNIVKKFGDGNLRAGVPKFEIGVVDVRDLSIAHFNAGFNPSAKGRHIISANRVSFLRLGEILKTHFGNKYPFPTRELPDFLVWLMAPAAGFKRKTIKQNLGHPWRVDNTKSIKELGVSYRSIEESIVDFFQQMIDNKIV